MGKTLVELAGFFLVAVGMVGLIIAAALVSTALAVGVGSAIALFAGGSAVYLANIVAASTKDGAR